MNLKHYDINSHCFTDGEGDFEVSVYLADNKLIGMVSS